jgi:hypothetical protein
VIVSVGSVAGATDAAPATGSSSASLDGCPNGFQLYIVADFAPQYVLPAFVDGIGNDNGKVCANQQPPSVLVARCRHEGPDSPACALLNAGLPRYNFTDDDVPGQGGSPTG